MPEVDPQKFLDTPIYAFDFQTMIGDVKDFLEFSENNIDWQYQREIHAVSQRQDREEYPSGYREQLEQNTQHRFLVSLALRVRYAGLLAFTTSTEWSIKLLNMGALRPVVIKQDGTNSTVQVMRELSARTDQVCESTIADYQALVNVRNCIAHSGGLLETYKFKDTLPADIARLPGFSLANWNFLGNQVCIERRALEPHIDNMNELVVRLHRSMHEGGLLQP